MGGSAKQKSKGKVLITGAGDFIGLRAVEMAVEAGYEVLATDLPGQDLSKAKTAGAHTINGDPSVHEQASGMIKGIDYVFHIGSGFDLTKTREELLKIHYESTQVLGRAAAEAKLKHFLLSSTADAYSPDKRIPVTEDFKQEAENDFSFAKVVAEQEIFRIGADTGMPVTVIRPSIIYGPGSIRRLSAFCVTAYFLSDLIGLVPKITGGPLINAVHVDDIVGSMIFLSGLNEADGQAFNVADNDWLPVGEFLEKIWSALGVKWSSVVLYMPSNLTSVMAGLANICFTDWAFDQINHFLQKQWQRIVVDRKIKPVFNPMLDKTYFRYLIRDHVYDNTKLKQLGYQFRYPHFESGIAQTMDWYRKAQWLPETI